MELDEKYVDVIVKRYIKLKGNTAGCFLIRGEQTIPLAEIKDFRNVLIS